MVDEVYLEMFYDARPPTAFRIDPDVSRDQQPDQSVRPERLCVAAGFSPRRNWSIACGAINDLYSATPVFSGRADERGRVS